MAGAVCGVIFGCALGATTLLLVDLEARHRIERAARLHDIVADMIAATSSSEEARFCDACTVYIVDTQDLTLPKDDAAHVVRLQAVGPAVGDVVPRCIATRTTLVVDGVLYAPVLQGDVVRAVVAFANGPREEEEDEERAFPREEDVLTARVMARHIAIFMDRLRD